jgi:hypothetical protein
MFFADNSAERGGLMRRGICASVVALGLLGLGAAACGGSSSSSSPTTTTTTTTTVPTTSTSVASAAGGLSAACAQGAQTAQAIQPRLQAAQASGNSQAALGAIQVVIPQFQAAANQPGTSPAVSAALNRMATSLQAFLKTPGQATGTAFASAAQQFAAACT